MSDLYLEIIPSHRGGGCEGTIGEGPVKPSERYIVEELENRGYRLARRDSVQIWWDELQHIWRFLTGPIFSKAQEAGE